MSISRIAAKRAFVHAVDWRASRFAAAGIASIMPHMILVYAELLPDESIPAASPKTIGDAAWRFFEWLVTESLALQPEWIDDAVNLGWQPPKFYKAKL